MGALTVHLFTASVRLRCGQEALVGQLFLEGEEICRPGLG